ncbi:Chloroperoxidase [Massariosphaeria phaeospora]|uniref:Chloroperoxidase n=1 Tax=Massariosphaeria phaeospora TaxID=100035 RepID=A0A7C8IAU2_9PLEO|nr:Chloroperoxidase [Massariosphaeria phaeospora]
MMNTLANHGYLPRDGRNITKENAANALKAALNFDGALASLMFDQAVIVNPEPNATFFTLDHLNQHNVLEHDASMSRSDAFFGNNHVYNETIFNQTRQYWTAPMLNATMLANGKLARQIESRAFNPNYTFTKSTEEFSIGEVCAPIIAFGDVDAGTVNRTLVEYLFENERLPFELGWTTRGEPVDLQRILAVSETIRSATNLLTPAEPASSTKAESPHGAGRRDVHFGFEL